MHSFTFERVITITFHFKVCFSSKTCLGTPPGKRWNTDLYNCHQSIGSSAISKGDKCNIRIKRVILCKGHQIEEKKNLCKGKISYFLSMTPGCRQLCTWNAAFRGRKHNSAAHWNVPEKNSQHFHNVPSDQNTYNFYDIYWVKWRQLRSAS